MNHQHRTRISVDCTDEEKRYIKMLAAREGMSMSEYLLSFPRSQMPDFNKCDHPKCDGKHEPNEESKKALKESREGKGTVFSSLDDFWKAMGIKPNAKT